LLPVVAVEVQEDLILAAAAVQGGLEPLLDYLFLQDLLLQ
jgi:hypothetical protein